MLIKFIKIVLLPFLIYGFSSFHSISDTGIKVVVTNLRNSNGHVLISLFKEGVGYPGQPEKAFRKSKVTITNNKAVLIFTDVPSGNYAIAILHDQNDDQKMNTNFFGLPKEGYGFSNNVMGTFGPPSYSKASFRHTAVILTELQIIARY